MYKENIPFDFFLLFSSNIETSCQQNKKSSDKLEIPCGTKFFRVLIFAIFPAIRKNNHPAPPPKKNHENTFPAKTYSRVLNIPWLKFTTQKYSTKKSCLFNYNSPLQFRNKTVYNELVLHNVRKLQYCLKISISITPWLRWNVT